MEAIVETAYSIFTHLLRISYQAGVLVLLIIGAQVVFRRWIPAPWRHALWFLLLLRLALPWTPPSDFSVFRFGIHPSLVNLSPKSPVYALSSKDTRDFRDSRENTGMSVALADANNTGRRIDKRKSASREKMPVAPSSIVQETDFPGSGVKTPTGITAYWRLALLIVWLTGAVVILIIAVLNGLKLQARVSHRRLVTDQGILDLLEDCKEEMGVHVPVALVESPQVRGPSLFGFVRPRLLLPSGAVSDLNREDLRWVFLHELAHVRRHDIALNWLVVFAQALHWFNPILWLAFYRMRTDCEMASDALVLSTTRPEESRDYGRALIHLLERFSHPRRIPALAGILEDKSHIKRRLTMIASFKKSSIGAVAVAISVLLFLACTGLTDRPHLTAEDRQEVKGDIDIAISNKDVTIAPYPEGGGLFEVNAYFRNNTRQTMPAFELQFYRGDPGQGGKPIWEGRIHGVGPIEPGKSWYESSMPFSLSEGEKIYVVADPNNKIKETDESNNKAYVIHTTSGAVEASATQKEKGAAGNIDIAVSNKDVTIVPYPEGGLFEVHAEFRNQTSQIMPAFELQFYRGDPAQGGKPIRPGGISGVGPIEPGKSWRESSLPFSISEGERIYVVADPNNKIRETDKSNNKAYAARAVANTSFAAGQQSALPGQGKYTEEQLRKMSVDEIFARIGNPEAGYHGFSGLWGLIDKAKISDQATKDAILKKAEEIIRNPKEDMFRRWQSCYVISGMDDARGIPSLAQTLREDTDETVREVAACALGSFDTPAAKDKLKSALKQEQSDEVRDWIVKAMEGQFIKPGKDAETRDAVTTGSRTTDERAIGEARDKALAKGDLVKAVEWEMERVKLRAANGNLYKDKIDLLPLWDQYRRDKSPSSEAVRQNIDQMAALLRKHQGNQDYAWRVQQLLALIYIGVQDNKSAGASLDAALETYPFVDYPDPSKHSKYQHLANERAELIWVEKGPQAAEDFMLSQLKTERKCEFCFLPWWTQQYKAQKQMDRYPAFLQKVKEAYAERGQRFPERKQLSQRYSEQAE